MTSSAELSQQPDIQDLLKAGLHFGHQTKRWNPKMKRYIFDKRNGIHVIDLAKTLALLDAARQFVYQTVSSGGKVLFVGTKKQAQQVVHEAATRCNQPYVATRWLGGTLTNNTTVRRRVKRLLQLESMDKGDGFKELSKKDVSRLRHELEKLRRNLSGIANMDALPAAVFVVDANREAIAVAEATTLAIPVIAILDTNCDPDPITYPIPANDDAIRAIKLIVNSIADTILAADRDYTRNAVAQAQQKAANQSTTTKPAPARKAPKSRPQTPAEPAAETPEAEPQPPAPVTPVDEQTSEEI